MYDDIGLEPLEPYLLFEAKWGYPATEDDQLEPDGECQTCSQFLSEDCAGSAVCVWSSAPEDQSKSNYLRMADGLAPVRYDEDEGER